ncbi:MAG: ATP synthase F0 subunit B [Eubacteriales bacterium]|nr:ATP synthase F0 subunit B [Eubacteriales bacterium]
MLRIDAVNLVCIVINLLILYFLMRKFLFAPVRAVLKQREELISNSFAEADGVRAEADALKKKYEESLGDLDGERTRAMAQTREEAAREYDRIVAQAKDQADHMVEQAREQAEAESRSRLQEAAGQIADLVALASARMNAATKSAESDSAIYDRFIKEAAAQTMTRQKEE